MAHFKRGNLQLKTNQQIQLGDSQESLILYDGTDLLLKPSSGALRLYNDGTAVVETISTGLQAEVASFDIKTSGGEDGITINNDGAVELFYDNTKVVETTSDGLLFTNPAGPYTANISWNGNDFQIINNENNQPMYFKTTDGVGSAEIGMYISGGDFFAMYNGIQAFRSIQDGLVLANSVASGDTTIRTYNGYMQIYNAQHGAQVRLIAEDVGGINKSLFIGDPDGAAELYYAGMKVFETDSTGVIVTGDIYCDDIHTSGDTIHVGTGEIKSTTGNIELYYSGGKVLETADDSIILTPTTTNEFFIENNTAGGNLIFKGYPEEGAARMMAVFTAEAGCSFYYAGQRNIISEPNGINIFDSTETNYGSVKHDGSDLFLEDTNVTVFVGAGDGAAELYYAGSKTIQTIEDGIQVNHSAEPTRVTEIKQNEAILQIINRQHNGGLQIKCEDGNGIERPLFYGWANGTDPKVAIYAGAGINVAQFTDNGSEGAINIIRGSAVGTTGATVSTNSNNKIFYLRNNYDGGNVYIQGDSDNDTQVDMMTLDPHGSWTFSSRNTGDTATNTLMTLDPDGASELYFAGELKLTTDSTGVTVIGTASADVPTLPSHLVNLDYMVRLGTPEQRLFYNVDQTGHLDIYVEHIRDLQSADFDSTIDPPDWLEGRVFWDKENHTFGVYNDVPEVTLQVGQESHLRVRNISGAAIPDGSPVYISGADQGLPTIELAKADDISTLNAVSIATHTIDNTSNGYTTVTGAVNDVNTSAFGPGDTLYVSDSTAGVITNERPKSPSIAHRIGVATEIGESGRLVSDSHPATDQMQVLTYTLPLKDVVDDEVPLTGTFREIAAGATTDITTPFAIGNQHLYIYVNSLTGSGNVAISGAQLSEDSSVQDSTGVEVITIDQAGTYYQTNFKWWEVLSIELPPGISAINFNYGVVGYPDMGNRNFSIIGYRCDAYSQKDTADFSIIINRVKDEGSKKMSIVQLEDFGVDSEGDGIVDNLRTGIYDRSYLPNVETVWPNNTVLTLKQLDFNTYFTSEENDILSKSKDEGFYIRIEGQGGGISEVDYVTLYLYYELLP